VHTREFRVRERDNGSQQLIARTVFSPSAHVMSNFPPSLSPPKRTDDRRGHVTRSFLEDYRRESIICASALSRSLQSLPPASRAIRSLHLADEEGLEAARTVVPLEPFPVPVPELQAMLLFAILVSETALLIVEFQMATVFRQTTNIFSLCCSLNNVCAASSSEMETLYSLYAIYIAPLRRL